MRRFALILLAFTFTATSYAQKVRKVLKINDREIESAELDQYILKTMASAKVPALSIAIINRGKIVYHRTFGVTNTQTKKQADENTIFEAASLSKPVFAYFTMKQVEKGLLDLDQPLYKYLPYPEAADDPRYKLITARMVLSHSSGLIHGTDGNDRDVDIAFTPGKGFQYSGAGYGYLEKVIAHLNNTDSQHLDEVFQRDVRQQLKTPRLYFKWNDDIAANKATGHVNGQPTGNGPDTKTEFGAAFNLHTNALNFGKFVIALLKKRGLSNKNFNEMFEQQVDVPAGDLFARILGHTGWGLGLAMQASPHGTRYSHMGNNGDFNAYFNFYPEHKRGIVLFTNSDKFMTTDFVSRLTQYLGDEIQFDITPLASK